MDNANTKKVPAIEEVLGKMFLSYPMPAAAIQRPLKEVIGNLARPTPSQQIDSIGRQEVKTAQEEVDEMIRLLAKVVFNLNPALKRKMQDDKADGEALYDQLSSEIHDILFVNASLVLEEIAIEIAEEARLEERGHSV